MKNNPANYFPERLLAQRPRFAKIYAQFAAADFDNYAEPTWQLRDVLREHVPAWQKRDNIPAELLAQQPRIDRSDPDAANPEGPQFKAWSAWHARCAPYLLHYPRLEEELEITKNLILFQRAGRNIFAITSALQEMLNHTAVDNIRWEDVRLPYSCLYLHFGPNTGIEFPTDAYGHKHGVDLAAFADPDTSLCLEGAFVAQGTGAALDMLLTFCDKRRDHLSRQSMATDLRFPVVPLTLDFNEQGQGQHAGTFAESILVFADLWDQKAEAGELAYGEMLALLAKNEFVYDSEREQYQVFDRALMLIINSLCYLSLTEPPIRTSTSSPQADELLSKIRQAKNKQRRAPLQQKLAKLSYSTIRFCGEDILSPDQQHAGTGAGAVVPHWRRGHWRRQLYGAGRTETRLRWIRPTIVRRDRGAPAKGHVYEV